MPEAVAQVESRRAEVLGVKIEGSKAECVLRGTASVLMSRVLAGYILSGDVLEIPLQFEAPAGTEILVHKNSNSKSRDIYQAPIGYVTKPKEDRRGQFYSLAEVRQSALGFSMMRLNCDVVRDYFYVGCRRPSRPNQEQQPTFYDALRTKPAASLAELRLAYRLRELELRTAGAAQGELAMAERAFNILADLELRACYDALLRDPETPVLFPYGGFGSLLVEGERSRDRTTFFAHRIIAFSPDRRQFRFKAPLRKFQFCADCAIYRDARRRLELVVDRVAMPLVWDPTWNRWKHLLGAKADVQATVLQTGVYRMKRGEWHLMNWEKALPSRISVTLPADIHGQIEAARRAHHRFGQFADFFERVHARIEREPVAKSEMERLCAEAGIPGNFDVAEITWQPDYDAFYYRELLKRARTMYLFRDEYIFELALAIRVEAPQSGHATDLFARPQSIDGFLPLYAS